MKRFFSLIVIAFTMLCLISCQKEQMKTTYTLKIGLSTASSTSAIQVDITAYEYNEAGEKIANNDYSHVVSGGSKTFTANTRSVKVKIYIKMYADNSSVTPSYRWVQQVYYLEPGKNIDISIEDNTKIGPSEP